MRKRVCAWLTILLLAGLFALLPASVAANTTAEPFTVAFEFYDSFDLDLTEFAPPGDATPLDPLQLKKDQYVTVAIRYSGLQQDGGLRNDGIRCVASALCYDASYFELQGFDEPGDDGSARMWYLDAEQSSANWIADALFDGYTVSASVQKIKTEAAVTADDTPDAAEEPSEERDIRRIYIQYIAEDRRTSREILAEDSGYLGAFEFQVVKEIPKDSDVNFLWDDLAVSLYEIGTRLDSSITLRLDDANTTTYFRAPKRVQVATKGGGGGGGDDPDPEGYTITGEIGSYNAKNPVMYKLYRMGGDGQYETTAAYSGELIPAQTTGTTSGKHVQTFTLAGVSEGEYKMVIEKNLHLPFTIEEIVVDANHLTQNVIDISRLPSVISFAQSRKINPVSSGAETADVQLCPGDANNDGVVGDDDMILLKTNGIWQAQLSNLPVNAPANVKNGDLDGDGVIGDDDLTLLKSNGVWQEQSENYNLTRSK